MLTSTRPRPSVYFALVVPALILLIASSELRAQPAGGPVGVIVARPAVREIVEWDEYTGRFVAVDSVEIRARVSGYLTEIAFEDGDLVDKGDLLFRVDPRPFEAELAAAEAELSSTDAAYRNALAESERGSRLLARKAISEESAQQRTRTLLEAQAARGVADARVRQARLNVEFAEIRAPIRGRISDDFVSIGNLIVGGAQGGTLLTTLVSMDPIHFEFSASEAEYLKYRRLAEQGARESGRRTHHPVRVRLMDEAEFAHKGQLSFVDNQIDQSTGTMRGRATFANPDGLFVPGLFGRLQLIGSGEYEAVLVPDSAVQTDQSEKFLWVVDGDNTVQRREVVLGPLHDGLRIVREGLAGKDRVVVSGTQFIGAGQQVSPEDADDRRLAELRLQ